MKFKAGDTVLFKDARRGTIYGPSQGWTSENPCYLKYLNKRAVITWIDVYNSLINIIIDNKDYTSVWPWRLEKIELDYSEGF